MTVKKDILGDDCYPDFLRSIRDNFNSVIGESAKLLTTDAVQLFEAFLSGIPVVARQHYTCRACKKFVDNFGGLVISSDEGVIKSALWNEDLVPKYFKKSVKAMKNIVLKSRVNGIFKSDAKVLGQPVTGEWHHMSVELPSAMVYRSRLKTVDQEIASLLEEHRILIAGLLEYSIETVNQAVTLLKTGSLTRSDRFIAIANWIKDLHEKCSNAKNSNERNNIIWLAVVTAPSGYCHIKSSIIGSLLDDISAGLSFESISRRFADKMDTYQRPQSAPKAGNIAQAEKIFKTLGLENSLFRRFAEFEEVQTMWSAKVKKQKQQVESNGVFSHVQNKGSEKRSSAMNIPPVIMTWRRFLETVLPLAENIEFLVKDEVDNYSAITTALHGDAPPIIQWDSEFVRNPFSWYIIFGGSLPKRWGLSAGYRKVTGVCYQPSMWNGGSEHQGEAVMFLLDGAKDSEHKNAENIGNALFPEILKSELREVRSTIEAFAKKANIEGYDKSSACGIRLRKGTNFNSTFRVTTNTGTAIYTLDRWD